MRRLAHLIYGGVKSGKPFDANFAMNGLAIQDDTGPRWFFKRSKAPN